MLNESMIATIKNSAPDRFRRVPGSQQLAPDHEMEAPDRQCQAPGAVNLDAPGKTEAL